MRTKLLATGKAALGAQDKQSWRCIFTSFKLYDAIAEKYEEGGPLGNEIYAGGAEQLNFVPVDENTVIIQATAERALPTIRIGAIELFIQTNDGTDIPFLVAINPKRFVKLSNKEDTHVGTKYTFQLLLSIPQLTSRFNFTNLKANVATFASYGNENAIKRWAWEEIRDQIIIQKHSFDGRLHFVLNAWGAYWGNPLAMKMNDSKFWKISGGRVGDRRQYTPE